MILLRIILHFVRRIFIVQTSTSTCTQVLNMSEMNYRTIGDMNTSCTQFIYHAPISSAFIFINRSLKFISESIE